MPTPPRRRPAAGPPSARRPKVAGLRKPPARPEPAQPDSVEPNPVEPEAADLVDQDVAEQDAVDQDVADEPKATETEAPDVHAADADEPEEALPVVSDGLISAPPPQTSDEAHKKSSPEDDAPKRPSPTGKRRATGRPVPSNLRGAERATNAPTRQKKAEAARSPVNLAITLAIAALLFAGLGFWLKGQGDRLTAGADRSNTAFVEPAATAEVKTKITSALERALSYDYKDLDRTATAVREVLAGKAVCEYDAMFGQLRELAPKQKLVHTTIVRELGVRYLSEDKAEALVFIDQTSTRVDSKQTTASGAQLGVSAERVDGTWKITAFDTFNQPLPNGQPLPQC